MHGVAEETHTPRLPLPLWVSHLYVCSQAHIGGPFCAWQSVDTSRSPCVLNRDIRRSSQTLVL